MIINSHGHVTAPTELGAYKPTMLSHPAAHAKASVNVSDEQIIAAANKKEMARLGHLDMLKKYGTDRQLISPRPFQMMHSQKPGRLVHWFCEAVNTIIGRQIKLLPDKFFGVAGLPQVAGEPIENTFKELDRCIQELG